MAFLLTDYFHVSFKKDHLAQLSSLSLAHIGDGVYEMMARCYVLCDKNLPTHLLHSRTVALVCASAQADAADAILPSLTEEERAVYKRGRNAKPGRLPRHTTHEVYAKATALEALFGWLFLNGKTERLNELFSAILREDRKADHVP